MIKHIGRSSDIPKNNLESERIWVHNFIIFGTMYDVSLKHLIFRKSKTLF